MKVVSLFSGAGALDLGLHQAGHEVILFCEADPGARQVLKTWYPGVQVTEDVASLSRLPEATELLAAGFPCVDVSRAGLRKGMDGHCTSLVRHVFRLLSRAKEDRRPVPWVLLENVEALLDRHGKDPPVIQYVLQQLMELGYGSWAYRVVNSASFGIPNRRRRVFILASMNGDARDVLLSQGKQRCMGSCERLFGGQRCFSCHLARLERGEDPDALSYALDLSNALSPAGVDVVPTFTTGNDRMLLLLSSGAAGMLRCEDGERLQGLPQGWTRPCWPIMAPGIGGHRAAAKGKEADAEQWAARSWELLGNAVTVPVARWLGERLAQPYAHKYHGVGVGDRRMDHLFAGSWAVDTGPGATCHVWNFVTADYMADPVIYPYVPGVDGGGGGGGEEMQVGLGGCDPEVVVNRAGEEPSSSDVPESNAPELSVPESNALEFSVPELDAFALERVPPSTSPSFPTASPSPPSLSQKLSQALSRCLGSSAGAWLRQAQDAPARTAGCASSQSTEELVEGSAASAGAVSGAWPEAGPADQDKLAFQSDMLSRARKLKLPAASSRRQSPWGRDSWPRCGWWVRGLGAFAVEDMSEAPVLVPYAPLGDFVECVGRPPRQEEVDNYISRLQERGWDASHTVARLLRNNARLSAEVREIVRLPGLLDDADMVGALVWARDNLSGAQWPAEVLDPRALPPGRQLPAGALEKLSSEQRLASLPPSAAALRHGQMDERERRVLALFFPLQSASWLWLAPSELRDYEACQAELEREANAQIRRGRAAFRWADKLAAALADARASLALRRGRASLEADRMRRTRAAAAAAAVDLKRRCGACKTCMNQWGGQRRFDCLGQRLKAAALAGHAGAQLAACGELAVGARVRVWWDGDATFYAGWVAHYDAVSTEHTVCYEDGEVGMHRLWQHDERIQVLTAASQWPLDAAAAQKRLGDAGRHAKESEREALLRRAAEPETLTDYEQRRREMVARNKAMFVEALAAEPAVGDGAEGGASADDERINPLTFQPWTQATLPAPEEDEDPAEEDQGRGRREEEGPMPEPVERGAALLDEAVQEAAPLPVPCQTSGPSWKNKKPRRARTAKKAPAAATPNPSLAGHPSDSTPGPILAFGDECGLANSGPLGDDLTPAVDSTPEPNMTPEPNSTPLPVLPATPPQEIPPPVGATTRPKRVYKKRQLAEPKATRVSKRGKKLESAFAKEAGLPVAGAGPQQRDEASQVDGVSLLEAAAEPTAALAADEQGVLKLAAPTSQERAAEEESLVHLEPLDGPMPHGKADAPSEQRPSDASLLETLGEANLFEMYEEHSEAWADAPRC